MIDLNLEPEEHERDIDILKLAKLVGTITLVTILVLVGLRLIDGSNHRLGTKVVALQTQDNN